ncbi:hypothetical protein IHE45_02G034500 [Dioscorea alata]|uniref:Uncharacterized protein n=1 Tax=Dioscorea alata TaxID=55571 RepID=A0ACB7WPH6_DIOAL|nr:hypothetical protein IHE45_02G034500 [Dioscorea alata]
MASGTKPIFVIFIIFSILLLLFTSTPTFAARPISTPTSAAISVPALKPTKPVPPTPRGQPYRRACKSKYYCGPPAGTDKVATRPNIKP